MYAVCVGALEAARKWPVFLKSDNDRVLGPRLLDGGIGIRREERLNCSGARFSHPRAVIADALSDAVTY
jgi:hypothetical protein